MSETKQNSSSALSEEKFPQVDFATLILSLSHSALVHLGQAPDPETNQVEKQIPLARQTIDVLAVLQEKTKGNLTGDEERLLEQLLFDLRMRIVELEKSERGRI
ncbi:DUF1844 domain-containing protein [Pajaroellobacter abortibovis]|uniref:DUF1844 domain-containing protein n=1 Tax=Pajaroellobacter abortibovis TaxID=1882918 RepID=A0A1L6MVW9_9BACT|nr:DUF1844 domain-containing protein [Pajaroellobacter abortibovis]APR99693.1 hypothetical protein BCY86_02640 [Pajaroellobacter abortibovis]